MALRTGWLWHSLPDSIATHFDFRGNADDFMDRGNFCLLMSCIYLFCVAPLFFVGLWFELLPARFQKIPSKHQWFGGDNEALRTAHISSIAYRFCAVGLLVSGFIALLTELILRANLHSPPHISVAVVLTAVVCFLVIVVAWVSSFHYIFEPKIKNP